MKMVFWAGVGTLFPFLMTTLGAALVFLMKKQSEDGPCMGFAAGVMSAAAVFSMILPAMRQNEGGWLIVTLGFMQDAAAIGRICAEKGVPFALDAAQTAGHLPVDFQAFGLSAMAVPGHKGLLGPGGVGALLLRDDFAQKLTPLIAGGTGSASDSEYLPPYLPDRFESGTANLPGCYGWEAALRFIEETGVDVLRQHERALCARFLDGLADISGVRLVGPRNMDRRVGVISVDFLRRDNAEMAYALEAQYGILTRCGLHCAPSAHRTLGTFPQGTVRFSLGFASTEADVDAALHAIRALA